MDHCGFGKCSLSRCRQDTHLPVYCWVLFDDHEAITTLSRGRAALREENGRSPRKAPPGPRSSAPTTTP